LFGTTFQRTIDVGDGGVLILDGVIVTEGEACVYVSNGGTLIMFSGEICNNTGFKTGGVFNTGVFLMYGGKISDNSARQGGGVHNSGNFTMFGGEISNNDAAVYNGGGVFNCGNFTMFGGRLLKTSVVVGVLEYTTIMQHLT
jgi:hypothetical protein